MERESKFVTGMRQVYEKSKSEKPVTSHSTPMTKEQFEQKCLEARAVLGKMYRDHDDALKAATNQSATNAEAASPDQETP